MSHAERPTVVVIAAKHWEIQWDNPSADSDGSYAVTSGVLQRITMGVVSSPEKKRESLLHEILHAIDKTYRTPKAEADEATIKLFASALFAVLVDNPVVANYIIQGAQLGGKETP